jgi:hypothetical protein
MHELVLPKDTTVREIWRIGLVAYRNAARQELKVSWCHSAAAAAICAKYPELKERQARQHLIEAVVWASKHHRAGSTGCSSPRMDLAARSARRRATSQSRI